MSRKYLDLRALSVELDELRSRRENDDNPEDSLDEDESARLKELEEIESQLGSSLDDYSRNEPSAIADSYFEEYAKELAEDMGVLDRRASWPNNFINWPAAAEDLQADYTSFDFDGNTYWIRSV